MEWLRYNMNEALVSEAVVAANLRGPPHNINEAKLQLAITMAKTRPTPAMMAAAAAATATATPVLAVDEEWLRKKALWVLRLRNEMELLDPRPREVRTLDQMPTLTSLRQNFVAHAEPLLVRGGAAQNGARWHVGEWTTQYFLEKHADRMVDVQRNRNADSRYEENSDSHHGSMPMREFIGRLRNGPANDVYMTANNARNNRQLNAEMLPQLSNLGPEHDAWLDMASVTDRAFLWIGGRGTVTPTHHDITNNVLVQISGRKRVRIAPAWALPNMYNHQTYFSFLRPDQPCQQRDYPLSCQVPWMTIDLQPGDVLLLPEGCWHFIEGLEENVSISFTCFRDGSIPHPGMNI